MNTNPQTPGGNSIRLLRVVLWLLPAIVLPVTLALMREINRAESIMLFAPFLILTTLIGYFDIRLIYNRDRRDPRPDWRRISCWAIAFTMTQIIIAPAVMMLILVITDYLNTTLLNRSSYWLP